MKPLISIGDLIDKSWHAYRSSFVYLLNISGWLVILAILKTLALLYFPSAGTIAYHPSLTFAEITAVIVYGFTNILLAPFLGFWIFISLVIAARSVLKKEYLSPKHIFSETKKRFFNTITVSILVGLTLLLAQVMTIGPSIVFGAIGYILKSVWMIATANILLIVGIIASLVLSSRWTLFYVMAPYATILEGLKNKKALSHSRNAIEGRFWRVLARLVVPKIIFGIFAIFIVFLFSFIANALLTSSVGLNADIYLRIISLIEEITPILIAIFLQPLILLSDVLLFENLHDEQSTANNS